MEKITCNSCNKETDSNSAKCEYCKYSFYEVALKVEPTWSDSLATQPELPRTAGNPASFEEVSSEGHNHATQILQQIKEEPEIHLDCEENSDQKSFLDAKDFFGGLQQIKTEVDTENVEHSMLRQLANYPGEDPECIQTNFKCYECGEIFSVYSDFKIHKTIHGEKKRYQCDECQAFLSTAHALRRHKSTIHSGDAKPAAKDFACMMCNKKFSIQILLANHMKTHQEDYKALEKTTIVRRIDNRLTYTCKLCGKITVKRRRHAEHLRTHTKEKPYPCEECEMKFSTRTALRRHKILHSDESPFKCNLCTESYRYKGSLDRHMLKHTCETPFKCEYCDKTFTRSVNKEDHERLQHTGETPYECPICGSCFSASRLLAVHRAKHNVDAKN